MLSAITFVLLFASVFGAGWDYDASKGSKTGPSYWQFLPGNEDCAGSRQSPIDINTNAAWPDPNLKPFTFINYEVIENLKLEIKNNGHSAQVTPTGVDMYIEGGGLKTKYKLWQFHFHWGADDTKGSEHLLDHVQFALELHLVHYKASFDSPSAAVASGEGDALAVLGFMFDKPTARDNPEYVELVKDLRLIKDRTQNSSVVGATFDIDALFHDGLGTYYRYDGSLTTPPCSELVVWSVFEKRLQISTSQLQSFRDLLDEKASAIEDNYRHPMPLNKRKVTKYMKSHPTRPTGGATVVSAAMSSLLASLLMLVFVIF